MNWYHKSRNVSHVNKGIYDACLSEILEITSIITEHRSLLSHVLSTYINISLAWLRNISFFSPKTSSVERCTNRRSLSILQSIIEITSLDNLCENRAFSVSQLMDIVLMDIVLLRIIKRMVHVKFNNRIVVFETNAKTRLKQ